MMSIDETIEFADKIYDLSYELENNFFDWDTYPLEQRNNYYESPVYRDCIRYLCHAAFKLQEYARGFKELQFCK